MAETAKIEPLIKREFKQMSEKYGDAFNSFHEAYAVTLEEVEEAEEDFSALKEKMKSLWLVTKKDNTECYMGNYYESIREDALHTIQELIQVAACCDKEISTFWE